MASRSELLLMALAVKTNLIRPDQVQECMNEQKTLTAQGQSPRLEDLVVAHGFLTAEQIAELKAPPRPKGVSVEDARRIPLYDVHEIIGQGGMATVFSATHRESGEARALKILFKEHVENKLFVERFLREAKLLRAFESENITKGYEYGRAGKDMYFVGMELIKGPSLQDLLERDGPFNEQKAIYCITEAAKALAYMQARGVVHRDIKPDNIMWNADGRVMLVDLGFATPIRQDAAPGYEDETCGTVQYISPEQAKGRSDLDIRADIYSLGATLYHLAMGEPPFTGRDSVEVMSRQVMDNLDAGALKSGRISMHMHYFIEKMMAKEREIRYQSAQDVVDDIEAVLNGAAELQFDPNRDGEASPFDSLSGRTAGIISGRHSASSSRRRPATGSGRQRPPGSSRDSGQSRPVARDTAPRDTGPVRLPDTRNTDSIRLPKPRHTTKALGGNEGSSRRHATAPTPPPVAPQAPPPALPVPPPGPSATGEPSKSVRFPAPRKKA